MVGFVTPTDPGQCSTGFLPLYSPDLNPIEQAFAKIKHWMQMSQKRTVEDTWRTIGSLSAPSSRKNAPTISQMQDALPSQPGEKARQRAVARRVRTTAENFNRGCLRNSGLFKEMRCRSGRTAIFDIFLVIAFGFVGYGMKMLHFPPAPLLLGFILSPMLLSRGDWMTFLNQPISAVFVVASGLLILLPVYTWWRGREKMAKAEATSP